MITLINPENKRVKIKNAESFSRLTGFSKNSLYSLSSGRKYCIKGWKSVHPRAKKEFKHRERQYTLINKETKEVVNVYNRVIQFAKERDLCLSSISSLLSGQRAEYKEWILKTTYDILYSMPPITLV